MKNIALFLLLFFTLGTVSSSASDKKKKEIKLHLKKGKTYQLNQVSEVETIQKIEGQDFVVKISLAATTSFEVKDFSDNVFSMDVWFENLSTKISNPYTNIEVNTESAPQEKDNVMVSVMHDMLKSIIGKTFLVRIDQRGKILQVSGINELFAYSLDVIMSKYTLDEPKRNLLYSQIIQSFGNEAVKSSLETILNIYPEQPVAIDNTWVKSIPVKNIVDASYRVEYKLGQSIDSVHEISGIGKFITNKSDFIKMGAIEVKYNLDGKYLIEIAISKESGWITRGKIVQKLDGTVDYAPNKDMPEGMKVPMSINTTSTF